MMVLDLREAARSHDLPPLAPGALAGSVIATWRGRMINEHGSSYVFDQLADQLAALGDLEAASECRTFAAEERRHGGQCGAVVEAAGGEAFATVEDPRTVPAHADTTQRAAV